MKFAVSRTALLLGMAAFPLAAPALAQTAAPEDRDTVFVLGRLEATAEDSTGVKLGGSEISGEEMRIFDLNSVDEAIDRVPGASASNTGGSRNERLIFVRGFDRFQTILSIDGVRVFLPADNRIDFGRFLTADLAEIQISKGYVSVLDGPGGVGGAVNLVTRKPSKAFEAEVIGTVTMNGDVSRDSTTFSGLLGTRQDQFYLQASGAISERDSWSLSDDFTPVVASLENGGERVNSASEDWRINLKAGWTPNDTDEYAISYIKQSGEKNAPYHISDTASTRFWTWPYWDIESLYFLSSTQVTPNLTLKSRVYSNKFENLLTAYDSATQNTQTLPRAFDSYYDDEAWGANVQLEAKLSSSNTLKSSLHYRKDQHNEQQDGFTRVPASGNPFVNAPYSEPWQPTKEDTWSIAVEDTQKLGDNLDLVVGASYDWTDLIEASDVNLDIAGSTAANPAIRFVRVDYPKNNMKALNLQAALGWRVNEQVRLYTSVSSRARFPTLFERFSSRFGTAIPNPNIDPERSVNYEVGGSWTYDDVQFQAAVFYSDLQDALIQIPVQLGAPFGVVNQTKNAGDGSISGAEASLAWQLFDNFEIGGNLTLLKRELKDPTNPAFQPQGVPENKFFLYADWQVLPNLTVTPSLDMAASRWTVTSSSLVTPPRFYETGSYGLVNLAVDWALNDSVSVLAGGKNLTDENYTLVDGFPEEGRSFYVSLRLRN